MSAVALGPSRSHHRTGNFPTKCILPVKFTPTGYQKEDYLRSSDGLHEWRRDIEYGMVAVYEFDDDEYRTFDWTRRVAGDFDGSGTSSVEGVARGTFPPVGKTGVAMQIVGGCMVASTLLSVDAEFGGSLHDL